MKPLRLLCILFFSVALFGCGTPNMPANVTPATISPQETSINLAKTAPPPTITLIPHQTLEKLWPTNTVWPTDTVTPTFEVPLTPNFTNVPIVVLTSSTPAVCPKVSQTHITLPETLPQDNQEFEKVVLGILNSGGIEQFLIQLPQYGPMDYKYEDLTHDSIRELVIRTPWITGNINVFGCKNGEFINLLSVPPVYDYGPSILAIKDINRDGVKELVVDLLTCHYCTGIKVFEWNGENFDSLVRGGCIIDYNVPYCFDIAEMMGYSSANIEDVDKNGTFELILEGGIPSYLGGLTGYEGPYRGQREVYMWDGKHFSWYSQKYDSPNFRFEAIRDGDSETMRGYYESALSSYQAAIFDDKLKSWDEQVWKQLLDEMVGIGYPDIEKMPFNQTEYDQLSAYARYRIVLLHLKRDWNNDAKLVYDTLQEKYRVGNPGHLYAEMATQLWNEYQATHNLSSACEQAVKYAQSHEEILTPLGGHGNWDYDYEPESVCPFYQGQQ
jgi:hypothetical protein